MTTTKRAWKKPTFVEIRMSAEIGSYQDELDERKHQQPPRAAKSAE